MEGRSQVQHFPRAGGSASRRGRTGAFLSRTSRIAFPSLKLPCALFAALLLGAAAPAAPESDDRIVSLLVAQSMEARVAIVAHRLATSAGDLCPHVPLVAMQVHDASQYGADWDAPLAAAFGGGPWPKVLAVVPGGAADRAGVLANDSILSIDGAPVPPTAERKTFARTLATIEALEVAIADGHAMLKLERDGRPVTAEVTGDPGCATSVLLRVSTDPQGKADGTRIEITSGLVALAGDEAELAAAVAHEMAHNILHHREELDAEKVHRGVLGNFGRSARLVRGTEAEADRLAVHLLDRAGYPMDAAVRMWNRLRGKAFDFLDMTHPGWKSRIALIEAEIAKIKAAKAKGREPVFER